MCLGSPLIPLRRCLPATHRPSRSKARWLDPITMYHNGSPPAQLLQAIIVYAVVVGELMDHRSPHLLRKGGGVPSRPVLKRSPEQYYAVGQESGVVGVPLAQGHPHVQAQQIAAVLNSPLGLGKVLLPRPLLHHHLHILQMAKKIFRKGVQSVSNEIGESLSGHLHHDGKDQYYQHQNKIRPAQQIHYPEIESALTCCRFCSAAARTRGIRSPSRTEITMTRAKATSLRTNATGNPWSPTIARPAPPTSASPVPTHMKTAICLRKPTKKLRASSSSWARMAINAINSSPPTRIAAPRKWKN